MARALGVEQGAIYTIIGPDGSRAVFNDPASPDFAGYLTEPPSGLERGGVRENSDTIPEADGGIHGTFRRDRLPFTLTGILNNVADPASVVAADRVLRASRALAADALLEWTPSTITEGVRVAFREQQPTRITGRRPKTFLVAGVAEDPVVYSTILKLVAITPTATATGGFTSPLTSPLTSIAAVAGSASALNDGSADVFPVYYIQGPCTNPVITNATTGQSMALTYTLAAGEYLIIDTNPRRRSVLFGTPATLNPRTFAAGSLSSRYSAVNFAASTWPRLIPGNNDLRVGFDSFSIGALLEAEYRDGWG